jgi:hypothetical protein
MASCQKASRAPESVAFAGESNRPDYTDDPRYGS